MKKIQPSKPAKDQREKLLLLGLVDLYLETGKPIGSNTLRENGFESLSSATIRNYFSKLEDSGYLRQQHSSGGRVPTPLALKLYADTHLQTTTKTEVEALQKALVKETRQITKYLSEAAETISSYTNCAVFLSAPRFDQDFVLDVKLVGLDSTRCLCILLTDFGQVFTENLYTDKKLSNFSIKRIEAYLQSRITGMEKPSLSPEEEILGDRFYKEIMLRHIINYANFKSEDVYKTGFAKLLNSPETLANTLSFFENPAALREVIQDSCKKQGISCAIDGCSVIAIPYKIHNAIVGSIAVLGPTRLPYKQVFALLEAASSYISEALTRSLYKFKIHYRQPESCCLYLEDKT